jgi:ferredoxin--NADP+ reductase
MAAWVEGRVIERIEWTPTLLSLRVEAELAPYKAGQFTKLALEQGERRVQRAYSFVNPPGTPYHEFYLVEIPGGELSPLSVPCRWATACWCSPRPPVF